MQGDTISRTVFPALGEYLYAITALAEIDVYLAVFSIKLLLAAHVSMAHVQAVLDASPLEPRLTADLHPERRFEILCKVSSPRNCAVALEAAKGAPSNVEIILHPEDGR